MLSLSLFPCKTEYQRLHALNIPRHGYMLRFAEDKYKCRQYDICENVWGYGKALNAHNKTEKYTSVFYIICILILS